MDMFSYEKEYRAKSYSGIVGVDEVGRGPYAGPVVAAAVILPADAEKTIPGLNDSKKLSAAKREELNEILHDRDDVKIGIVELSHEEVDKLNILQATHKAMRMAVEKLMPQADFILVDGKAVPNLPLPSQNIIKGDSKSASIAAASIVAKVYRDRLIVEADAKYPGYGFAKNMGYGTKEHREALEKIGVCPIHRRSFAPIAELLGIKKEEKKAPARKKKKTKDPNQPMLF